jgi:hypothetical protein
MAGLALLTVALTSAALSSPAWADSSGAFCRFSQRQGNVNVEMGKRWAFRFASDADGKDVQRENTATGIRFNSEGHYTLSVFWQKPAPRP